MPNDIRTQAIVLRRTKYGESDRIINLITPEGKIAVLAKGVRKEKSKLAGGIELFTVADVVIHQGKSNLGTLTSAKMLQFYGKIMSDISCLELASECLRKTEKISEQNDNPDYFNIIQQVLAGINCNYMANLIKIWFAMQMAEASGEDINLISDTNGDELQVDQRYFWDSTEKALRCDYRGNIGVKEIKLARIILTQKLNTVAHIQNVASIVQPLEAIARAFEI